MDRQMYGLVRRERHIFGKADRLGGKKRNREADMETERQIDR